MGARASLDGCHYRRPVADALAAGILAPMFGWMVSSEVLALVVIPAVYGLRRELRVTSDE